MQASEAAVAHDEHLIAGPHLGGDGRDECLDAALDAARELPAARARRANPSRAPAISRNHARSAAASAGASSSRCTPSFMVFERGSSTAMIRASGKRARKPASVVSIAVG